MDTSYADTMIIGGSANPLLATAVAGLLGLPLAACTCTRFPDGEVAVELGESVRHKQVFLVQPTAPPVDLHLMELLAVADACRRAAAARIIAVVPYFGYSRADKRQGHRVPIMARLVADLIQTAGVDHLITFDLHASQIEGFFQIPVDNLSAVPIFTQALSPQLPQDLVVVSPDQGRVRMATDYAQRLGAEVAVLHKQRTSGTETTVTQLVGRVRGRAALIIDDMIVTGGTLRNAITALTAAGARPEIYIAATHGLLLPGAQAALSDPAVRAIYITDTVARPQGDWPGLQVVAVAPMLAQALRRILSDGSLHNLG